MYWDQFNRQRSILGWNQYSKFDWCAETIIILITLMKTVAVCTPMTHECLSFLFQWLRALPSSRQSFNMIFGECPYCSKVHVHISDWLLLLSTNPPLLSKDPLYSPHTPATLNEHKFSLMSVLVSEVLLCVEDKWKMLLIQNQCFISVSHCSCHINFKPVFLHFSQWRWKWRPRSPEGKLVFLTAPSPAWEDPLQTSFFKGVQMNFGKLQT